MALDEPTKDDRIIDRGSYRFIMDSQVEAVVRERGGLQIDFVDEAHQKGYLLRLTDSDHSHGSCSC